MEPMEPMKRILTILLIAFVASLSPAQAQLLSEWGFKGGVTVSNQDWKYALPGLDRGNDRYVGLNLGLCGALAEKGALSAIGDVSYVQKGATLEFRSTVVDSTTESGYREFDPVRYRDRFDHVSLCLYGRIKLRFRRLSPFVIFGTRVDVLVGKSVETIPKEAYEKFEKLTLGVSLGLGSEFETFLPFKTLIGFRYDPDLSNLYETEHLTIRKRSCEIELGVVF
jgi:hypothetical protein